MHEVGSSPLQRGAAYKESVKKGASWLKAAICWALEFAAEWGHDALRERYVSLSLFYTLPLPF